MGWATKVKYFTVQYKKLGRIVVIYYSV